MPHTHVPSPGRPSICICSDCSKSRLRQRRDQALKLAAKGDASALGLGSFGQAFLKTFGGLPTTTKKGQVAIETLCTTKGATLTKVRGLGKLKKK